jgi:hypothetical protein
MNPTMETRMSPIPDGKDPLCYTWLEYGWVIFLSVCGTVVHFLDENRHRLTRERLFSLLIDVAIAPFTGIVTFFLCEAFNLERVATAGVIGLVSHMGSRGLGIIRKTLLKKFFNTTLEDEQP